MRPRIRPKKHNISVESGNQRGSFSYRAVISLGFAGILWFVLLSAPSLLLAQVKSSPQENLRDALSRLTQQIDSLRSSLRQTRTEERSIEQQIRLYDQEIRQTELSLQRSQDAIEELQEESQKIQEQVTVFESDIAHTQRVIAEFLRVIAQRDEIPPYTFVFSGESFSQLADDMTATEKIERQLADRIASLRALESDLAQQRKALEEKQTLEAEAQRVLVLEKDELGLKRDLQAQLLAETKNKNQAVANRIIETEKDAARIRTQLYLLADLGRSLPFGDAYALTKPIGEKTGIRPALLLAVLQKESRLGALVGTGTWRIDMHPRDWPAFMQITAELGLDPDHTPVSRKPSYGWGGAMGPAQFLPTTWFSYKDRIAQLTGNGPPSPWVIQDAFAAAALKLAVGGADAKTADAEWKAAMLYFAGGNWNNPAYAFYGDAVEALAAVFQEQIDILESENPKS